MMKKFLLPLLLLLAACTSTPKHVGKITLTNETWGSYQRYAELIKPILEGRADVVYGSRLSGAKVSRAFNFWHYVGNKMLTFITNLLYNSILSDMETCYKVFRADVIKNLQIKSNKFDFEPEITAKVLKRKHKLYEMPISYYGRDFSEGKKITWRDGFGAIWALIKYRFVD